MSRCAMIMPKVVQQLLAAACGVRFCKIVVGLEDVEENDAGRCWGNAVCSYLKEPYTDLEDDELEALLKEKARTVLAEIYRGIDILLGQMYFAIVVIIPLKFGFMQNVVNEVLEGGFPIPEQKGEKCTLFVQFYW